MPLRLTEKLLPVVAAIEADDGRAVLLALTAVLEQEAPFDHGEMIIVGRLRKPLRAGGPEIAGPDLLDEVTVRGKSVRLDHLGESERFPVTLALLEDAGLRSVLAIPFAPRPGLLGALVLARRHGWGLVGASLPTLEPLAAFAACAVQASIDLSERPAADAQLGGGLEASEAALAEAQVETKQLRATPAAPVYDASDQSSAAVPPPRSRRRR